MKFIYIFHVDIDKTIIYKLIFIIDKKERTIRGIKYKINLNLKEVL